MTLRQYISIMVLGTVLCWTAWWVVVIDIDPFQDTGVGFSFFYVSFFLAILGMISILAFVIRRMFSREELPMFKYVQKSFRDSLFISILLVLLLYLQGQGHLRWWNFILLLLIIIFYLGYSWSIKKYRTNSIQS